MQRSNLSQSTKHLLQPRLFSPLSKPLHKDVITSDLLRFTLVVFRAFDVGKHFEFFAFVLRVVGFTDSVRSVFFTGELHVGEAARETVSEAFEFAFLDFAEFGVELEDVFLGYCRG